MSKPRPKSWPAMAKARGREAENAVCEYLKERGIPAERRRQTGTSDCGDISGWPGVTVEVKAEKRTNLASWLDEAQAEADHADKKFHGGRIGIVLVVAKRRGNLHPAGWYAIMPLTQAVTLIQGAKS